MEDQPLFWDVLRSRRSIRKFKSDPVSAEITDKILAAGIQAPNARHRQTWRFAVCSTPVSIAQLADALNEKFKEDLLASGKSKSEVEALVVERKERICGAPLIIVLFVDVAEVANFSVDSPINEEYLMAVQSAALAGGQMLLSAEALGFGGVWMGAPLYAQKREFCCSCFH